MYFSCIKRLRISIVTSSSIFRMSVVEEIQLIRVHLQRFSQYKPVNRLSAWRSGQRPSIIVEFWFPMKLSKGLFEIQFDILAQLIELQMFQETIRWCIIVNFKENSKNCQISLWLVLFVTLEVFSGNRMHNMAFQRIALSINGVLRRVMEVKLNSFE